MFWFKARLTLLVLWKMVCDLLLVAVTSPARLVRRLARGRKEEVKQEVTPKPKPGEPQKITAEELPEKIGSPVTPMEVAQCAKKNCQSCFGSGRRHRIIDGKRVQEPCKCGLQRFVRLHNDELVRVNGQLFWKPKVPGSAPTRGDATRLAAMIDSGALDNVIHKLNVE